jgi:hypothetical protein
MLWDEKDGFIPNKVYIDKESAEIALVENYTEYWILAKKAKICEVDAVSYVK